MKHERGRAHEPRVRGVPGRHDPHLVADVLQPRVPREALAQRPHQELTDVADAAAHDDEVEVQKRGGAPEAYT